MCMKHASIIELAFFSYFLVIPSSDAKIMHHSWFIHAEKLGLLGELQLAQAEQSREALQDGPHQ